MKQKKNLWIIIAAFAVVAVVAAILWGHKNDHKTSTTENSKQVVMVIPATLQAFTDIETGLKNTCKEPNYHIKVLSAEGDGSKFKTVLDDAIKSNSDYLVAIGSQVLTTALSERNKEKLPPTIAGAISVPSALPELVNIGINPPRNFPLNIVSHVPQSSYKKVIDVLSSIKPSIKKIGILYNESEMNSKNMKDALVKCIEEAGVTPILGAVTTPEDVSKVTEKLIRTGAEAIIIPHDKSATAKASTVAKLCNNKNILTASLDEGVIKDGIMFAVSVPYEEVGNNIGKIIIECTENNIDLKNMPLIELKESDLRVYVNSKILKENEITLSEEMTHTPIIKK
ncbi:MAG: hypothetical protein K6F40_02020 [Bacteroidales bacterium]|nr:hypothetical protein [Bacteroidales bacterium]